ncbi:tyrosine-type recombinase/integrase [Actinocatenispora comari]|uniref:Tyr recombinase domain-containing protein n=1 Tax=Actinocatenispora comari TaxID=2807577 RepID=A0A8J4AF74_9ACTN|nr:site-specific integrase [Actinocatenispora comari]GIL29509.1 hypothetical protein NUM_47630 [Actinocatenispora comari]
MGWVMKTPAGSFRANWRDPSGKERSRTFKAEDAAYAHIDKMESTKTRGSYVDDRARKVRFRDHTVRWLKGRHVEARTDERTMSLLRTHIIPKWGGWRLGSIDHLEVQGWVTELGRTLAPATVAKCFGLVSSILAAAVRSRILDVNPADGVVLPKTRSGRRAVALTRAQVFGQILPAIASPHHRILVWLAAGAGLRWGECAGMPWGAVDLDRGVLHVAQVAVETSHTVELRPYPKTEAGRRTVPMGAGLSAILREYREMTGNPSDRDLVVLSRVGRPMRRANFRKRVWRPALVRAGLLGEVHEAAEGRWRGAWPTADGIERTATFGSEHQAVTHVALHAAGGPRFHDLRHSYATWLVSDGLPINDVQRAMGHTRGSTTLNLYTHPSAGFEERIRRSIDGESADFLLTFGSDDPDDDGTAGVPLPA